METIFKAADGTEFATAKECREYEKGDVVTKLVGLTAEQLKAATTYQDKDLCRAIEAAGRKCAAARIESGDVARRSKPKVDPQAEQQPEAQAETAAEPDAPNAEDIPADTPARRKKAA